MAEPFSPVRLLIPWWLGNVARGYPLRAAELGFLRLGCSSVVARGCCTGVSPPCFGTGFSAVLSLLPGWLGDVAWWVSLLVAEPGFLRLGCSSGVARGCCMGGLPPCGGTGFSAVKSLLPGWLGDAARQVIPLHRVARTGFSPARLLVPWWLGSYTRGLPLRVADPGFLR